MLSYILGTSINKPPPASLPCLHILIFKFFSQHVPVPIKGAAQTEITSISATMTNINYGDKLQRWRTDEEEDEENVNQV